MGNKNPFRCFHHDIFKCWEMGLTVKEKGKVVHIDLNSDNEIAMFFKIDGKYILKGNKFDYMAYYYNFKKEREYLVMIELKGVNYKKGIHQFEYTFDNEKKIKDIITNFNGYKLALIVSSIGAPKNQAVLLKDKFMKKYNVILEIKARKRINLRDICKSFS